MTKPKTERPKREGIMLAYPLDEGKLRRIGSPFFVQPKFRGERCKTVWFHEEPVLLTSYANAFPYAEHIKAALKAVREVSGFELQFDGELYKHGWSQERISSAARSPVNYNPDNKELQYYIFDHIQPGVPQDFRFNTLISCLNKCSSEALIIAPTFRATIDQWHDAANEFIDAGYEGLIIRSINGSYVEKRSTDILKFKPTETDNYTIIEILEAMSIQGEPKAMIGAFRVMDADGNTFKVGAGKLKHEKRIEYWRQRRNLIGRQLVVKHELLRTDHDLPVCAVAVDLFVS